MKLMRCFLRMSCLLIEDDTSKHNDNFINLKSILIFVGHITSGKRNQMTTILQIILISMINQFLIVFFHL